MVKKPDLTGNDPRELWAGQSLELLQALHILTRDGKLNADTRRKLKQVYHLIQFIEPLLEPAYQESRAPACVDLGAGKSYLGFLLYDLVLRERGGSVLSVESRPELVQSGKKLALASGFERMTFQTGAIADAPKSATPPDLVMALHACDTATDDAILYGLEVGARAFALVPCCQAEAARLLQALPIERRTPLFAEPLHAREFGSHLTNVIRVLTLQSRGYRVRVTELTGWEHSLKNELILAEKISDGYPPAEEKLRALLAEFPIETRLLRGLAT